MDSIGSIIVTASKIQEVFRMVSHVIQRFKPTHARLLKGTRRRDEGEARVLETTSTTTIYYIPSEYLSQVYLRKRSPVKLPNGIQPDPVATSRRRSGLLITASQRSACPWKVLGESRVFCPIQNEADNLLLCPANAVENSPIRLLSS